MDGDISTPHHLKASLVQVLDLYYCSHLRAILKCPNPFVIFQMLSPLSQPLHPLLPTRRLPWPPAPRQLRTPSRATSTSPSRHQSNTMAQTYVNISNFKSTHQPADQPSPTQYKYASYLPHHVPGRQPPLQEFEHHDPGARADPDKKALLSGTPGAAFEEITPAVGTEVRGGGLQLSRLTAAQRDELALLAAERGVVVFRDQDLADAGPEAQRALGRHFGPLHVHQHGGQVRGFPELLPVYRDFAAGAVDNEIKNNVSSVKWHSDMSYEM